MSRIYNLCSIWEVAVMGLMLFVKILQIKVSFFFAVGYIVFIRRKYQDSSITRQSYTIIHQQLTKIFEKYPAVLSYYLKVSNVFSQMAPTESKNS